MKQRPWHKPQHAPEEADGPADEQPQTEGTPHADEPAQEEATAAPDSEPDDAHDKTNGADQHNDQPLLVPDRQALACFADIMFRYARPDGYISLRAFPDKSNGGKKEKPIFIESIQIGDSDFLDIATERARQAATWPAPAVFAPPVATFKNGRDAKGDNLDEGVGISTECDQTPQTARATLEALLGAATVVVESGGQWVDPATGEIEPKLHLHWRLNKPTATKAEHALLYEARELATKLVGADATCIPIVHPMRWPGSWHRKGAPRLAKIVATSENEIDLDEALAFLRDAVGATDYGDDSVRQTGRLRAADHAAVAEALVAIPNNNLSWHAWNNIGMAAWASTDGSDTGRKAFAAWSAKAKKNDTAATEARWQHYATSPPTRIGFGTLVYLARKHSPGWTYGPQGAGAPIDPVDLWAKFAPPTLPRGLLPKLIEDFAFDRGSVMGCDMAGLAVGALVVCAASIPETIKLQPKRHDTEWQEAARLWATPVGGVSEMKSPMLNAVTKEVREIDGEMSRAYAKAMSAYYALPKPVQKVTPRPKLLRAKVMSTTVEACENILQDSPNGVLLEQDELSGWFGMMDKYSGARGAAADRAFWLQAYNGGPFTVDRVGRGHVHIPNLSVSILGPIQPELIRKLADGGVDDGLLQRFLPIVLRSAVGGRDEPPGQVVADYGDLIRRLRELRPPESGGPLPLDAPLIFDDGALKIREALEKRHLELIKLKSLNRKLTSHIGKYNGIFARLCVIWHCVEHANDAELPPVVSEHTARRVASFLHDFLLQHALAFYIGVLGLTNDHDRLANVADYILAHKLARITNRDVQHGDRDMRDLKWPQTEAIFQQLEALGWVTQAPGPRRNSPPHWVVNPVVHQKFAARAEAERKRREEEYKTISGLLNKRTS